MSDGPYKVRPSASEPFEEFEVVRTSLYDEDLPVSLARESEFGQLGDTIGYLTYKTEDAAERAAAALNELFPEETQ